MRTTLSGIEILENRIAPAAASLSLPSLNGGNGFKLNGVAAGDISGFSVSGAGDVNGDGFADVIIGAYQADSSGYDSGASYVIFGSAAGFNPKLDLDSLDGTNGFKLSGGARNDGAGRGVSGAGDVNGDGFDDVIIGTKGAYNKGGAAYVIFGKAGAFAPDIDVSALDGNGFVIRGATAGDYAGYTVSSAGDVNADGFDDVIIGALFADPHGANSGASYVVFGKSGGFVPILDVATLDGVAGYKLSGVAAGDSAGRWVSGAGDINGDAFDDIIIGGFGGGPGNTTAGKTYVVFGKATGYAANFDLATLNGDNGFVLSGGSSGGTAYAVSKAGDVNGDGFGDVIVGVAGANSDGKATGASYVVFGKGTGFAANLDLSELDGSSGFKLSGISDGDQTGRSVSGAGDVNGDGFDDLLIGAPRARNSSGVSYVVFGKGTGFGSNLDLAALDGTDGFAINGARPDDIAGYSVSNAGDVNGDGFDDLLIGSPHAGKDVGATYVVFGFDSRLAAKSKNTAVTFSDQDGDLGTIKVAKGSIVPQDVVLGPDGQLQLLKLSQAGDRFEGATITITAKKGTGGDGFVNVGAIDATGLHLAKVIVKGDLGQVDAGTESGSKPALKALTVQSLGALGGSTQIPGTIDPLISEVLGSLPKLTVKTDLKNAIMEVTGSAGRVKIGGDITGETTAGATVLAMLAEFGRIIPRVSGGVPTGSFVASGIGTFTVGGDMHGGSVQSSGDIGSVTVAGGVTSAAVAAEGHIPVVKVFGNLASDNPAAPSVVTALARTDAASSKGSVAINNLLVRGDVENARILLGFNKEEVGKNPDASAGKVIVNGDWSASSLVAGMLDSSRDGFGQNDTPIGNDTTPSIVSRIASILIKGSATGSTGEGDHFGITAQEIGKLSIGGEKVALSKTEKDDILLDAVNSDFRVVEV